MARPSIRVKDKVYWAADIRALVAENERLRETHTTVCVGLADWQRMEPAASADDAERALDALETAVRLCWPNTVRVGVKLTVGYNQCGEFAYANQRTDQACSRAEALALLRKAK